jgi:tetratricopeptide (TPR) repeat protein
VRKPGNGWKTCLMVLGAALLSNLISVNNAEAQQVPEPTIPVSQMTAQQLETRGDAFRSQKDPISALESYMRAIAKNGNNAVVWNKVGMIQLQLGASSQGIERLKRYGDARRDFERAVKLKKD